MFAFGVDDDSIKRNRRANLRIAAIRPSAIRMDALVIIPDGPQVQTVALRIKTLPGP